MAIAFLLDENLPGRFVRAVARHNLLSANPLDVVAVGGTADLPLGIDDASMLVWSEREGRIVVSEDRSTLPRFLAEHLTAGHSSPGVFLVRRETSIPELIEFLVLAAYASEAEEWKDQVSFIPSN